MNIAMVRGGNDLFTVLCVCCGQMLPHFSIEYRKHFTNFHATVVETAGGIQIGATEAVMISIMLHLMFACSDDTNEWSTSEIDLKAYGMPFNILYG